MGESGGRMGVLEMGILAAGRGDVSGGVCICNVCFIFYYCIFWITSLLINTIILYYRT